MLSYFVPSINPYEQPMSGLLAYLAPIMAVLNFFYIFFWIVSRKYFYLIIPFIALVFSWKIWTKYIAFNVNSSSTFEHSDSSFSVMSYNARLLDLYNWTGNKHTRTNMISYFQKMNSSVLCLQEFYTGNDSAGFDNINAIKYACNYPYVSMCDINVNKRGRWGSVIFSKFPILQSIMHDVDVKGSNLLQQVNIKINTDTIRLFNLHLKSNRFTNTETDLVGKNELPELNNKNISITKQLYQKVIQTTVNRGLEAELVAQIIKKEKYNCIVCGDLNDIPSSFVYFKTKASMKDAFLEKGMGIGATYSGAIPVLRIDYIFFSKDLKLNGFKKEDVRFTDHFPLVANFSKR